MSNSPNGAEKELTPEQKLLRKAWMAVKFGGAGVVLLGLAIFTRGNSLILAALALGLLGNVLSLGVLWTAIFRRSRYRGESIGQISVLLPIPFVLILPLCYSQALGLGLGGDTAASNFYGTIGLGSLVLVPITFIAGLVAGIRGKR